MSPLTEVYVRFGKILEQNVQLYNVDNIIENRSENNAKEDWAYFQVLTPHCLQRAPTKWVPPHSGAPSKRLHNFSVGNFTSLKFLGMTSLS